MRFNIANFLLLITFIISILAIIFGGFSIKGEEWLIDLSNNKTIGLSKNIFSFFTIGFAFQTFASVLVFIALIISIIHDSFAQKWNVYVIIFMTIITMFIMGLIIMILSGFWFINSETQTNKNLKLSFFRSYSFIYFMVNIFCSILVVGLIFFSLGYMSNENVQMGDDSSSSDIESDYQGGSRALGIHAFHDRALTQHQVPLGTPVPNSSVLAINYNAMNRLRNEAKY